MGMGNYACRAETVEEDFVKEICPKELQVLIDVLEKVGQTLLDLGAACTYGDIEEELFSNGLEDDEIKSICDAYDNLCTTFDETTGLELCISYHNKKDRGDEVDGYFWQVDGVFIYSLAGEEHKDKITTKSWVVWG
ncbi:MAG: hypothetical protein J7L15_08280 [Clostridiales bacterium]|nr:hypothetical protein [Clostridiales bacterium]